MSTLLMDEIIALRAELRDLTSQCEFDAVDRSKLVAEVGDLKRRLDKLKSLMLLTDKVVEHYEMNEMTIEQWMEYIRCFPDEVQT